MTRAFRFLTIFVSLSSLAPAARSQWTVTARKLMSVLPVEGSAIVHKDGIVWAGDTKLYFSRDSGVTWRENTAFPLQPIDRIEDIQLFDTAHVLVTGYFGIYLSTNGGSSWRILLDSDQINYAASGCFAGSPDTLVVSDYGGGIWVSNNAGASWTTTRPDSIAEQIMYRNGSIYVIMGVGVPPDVPFSGGTIYRSKDRGATWQPLPGVFAQDSYSFTFDSCAGTIYMTNEGYSDILDTVSQIISSSDGGASWQVSATNVKEFFSGSIATGRQCIFTSTSSGGVYRLTGATWGSIGGPNGALVTRSICAINDDMILAFDANGSIFRTTNSGGVPVPGGYQPPSISSYSLFANDSISPCAPQTRTVTINPYTGTTCRLPTILSQAISGPDSAYYHFVHTADASLAQIDSDVVLLHPGGAARDYSATLTITLSDGTVWHVTLGGRSGESPNVELNVASVTTDTIGELTLPITGTLPVSVSARLEFDTSLLRFLSATDRSGNEIDVATTHGAELLFDTSGRLATDTILGFLKFMFYPTSRECAHVSIDSVQLPVGTTLCGVVVGSSSEICFDGNACEALTLSPFLENGALPYFRIVPNPTSGVVEIVRSGEPLSTPHSALSTTPIEILDALGRVELRTMADLSAPSAKLDLTALSAGPKLIHIRTAAGMRVLTVMLTK